MVNQRDDEDASDATRFCTALVLRAVEDLRSAKGIEVSPEFIAERIALATALYPVAGAALEAGYTADEISGECLAVEDGIEAGYLGRNPDERMHRLRRRILAAMLTSYGDDVRVHRVPESIE